MVIQLGVEIAKVPFRIRSRTLLLVSCLLWSNLTGSIQAKAESNPAAIIDFFGRVIQEGIRQERQRRQQVHDQERLTRELQTHLAKLQFYRSAIDGRFGPATERALQNFLRAFEVRQQLSLEQIVSLAQEKSVRGWRSASEQREGERLGFQIGDDYRRARLTGQLPEPGTQARSSSSSQTSSSQSDIPWQDSPAPPQIHNQNDGSERQLTQNWNSRSPRIAYNQRWQDHELGIQLSQLGVPKEVLISESNPNYEQDRKTGCKLFVSFFSDVPKPREVEWSGKCVDGFAEGFGEISYFSVGELYWTHHVGPRSGIQIRRGRLARSVEPTWVRMKVSSCRRYAKISAYVPDELNLADFTVLRQIVSMTSRAFESRSSDPAYDRCRRVRGKDIAIFRNSDRLTQLALFQQRNFGNRQDNRSMVIGNEIWKWDWGSLVDYSKKVSNKNNVLNQIRHQQQQERIAQERERQRIAAQQAQKQLEEKRRQQQIEQQRAQETRRRAEQARIAERRAETERLTELAAADAESRDSSSPADSFCIFRCDPLEKQGRQALQEQLSGFFETPVILMKFRKTNGVSGELQGTKIYEMHYEAEIELPMGFITPKSTIAGGIFSGGDGMTRALTLKRMIQYKSVKDSPKWTDPWSIRASGKIRFKKSENGWIFSDLYP